MLCDSWRATVCPFSPCLRPARGQSSQGQRAPPSKTRWQLKAYQNSSSASFLLWRRTPTKLPRDLIGPAASKHRNQRYSEILNRLCARSDFAPIRPCHAKTWCRPQTGRSAQRLSATSRESGPIEHLPFPVTPLSPYEPGMSAHS